MPRQDERPEERARREMVTAQLRRRGIADERILSVMGALPRERFLPARYRDVAYADAAAPIDEGQTISQPYIVARMTELLRVVPGDRLLEIGTGSGYQAAVLARLEAQVTSIERVPALASAARERLTSLGIENVEIRVGDGSLGDPAGAPWDGIIVTAAAPAVPSPLREQLAIGARLVVPVGGRWEQELLVIERRGRTEWVETSDGAVVFVPLIGRQGFAEPGWREPESAAPEAPAPEARVPGSPEPESPEPRSAGRRDEPS